MATSAVAKPQPTSSPSIRILPPTSLDWTQFSALTPPRSHLLLAGRYDSREQAVDACRSVGETLVDAPAIVNDQNLHQHLAHLVYEGLLPYDNVGHNRKGGVQADYVQQFIWADHDNLISMNSNGDGSDIQLRAQPQANIRLRRVVLPALCTNSAPWKTVNSTDTSPRWRVSANVGSGPSQTSFTGFRDLLGFRFAAIPYAATPARFEPSQPLLSSDSLHKALGSSFDATHTSRAKQCPQTSGTDSPYTEDCLVLNIATGYLPSSPRNPDEDSLLRPIIFWIHGGGFFAGSGLDGTFDGTGLSSRNDIVVISPNYRLGTLGWLAVSDHVSPGLKGNLGLGDIIAALRWVRAHASSFGGDPKRISVVGQSAGAQIVQLLLQSEAAAGLFQSAVVMSGGPWDRANERLTRAQAEKSSADGGANGLAVLQSLGCAPPTSALPKCHVLAGMDRRQSGAKDPVLECLRQLPTERFLTASPIANRPIIDGTLVRAPTLDMQPPSQARGHVNRVPLLLGTMRDELGSLGSVPAEGTSLEDALSRAGISDPQKSAVVQNKDGAFPRSSVGRAPVQNLTVTVESEITSVTRCGQDSGLNLLQQNRVFPTIHAYEFHSRAWQIPNYDPNAACAPRSPTELSTGTYFLCHSGDLMSIFASGGFMFALTPRDGFELDWIRAVSDAWAQFARSGGTSVVMEAGYARVRGYERSREAVRGWRALGSGRREVALLGAGGVEGSRTLGEGSVGRQCSALGSGINYIRDERT
ncbi:hypothetical protein V8E36_004777 [Tilletia maclaganii]